MEETSYRNKFLKIESIDDKKKLLVFLLKEFHEVCNDNDLIYNVFGGTLLGTIRHHGMIPWDDDVDITMPRNDYEKLIKLVKTKYKNKFGISCYPDKGCCYPYAKFTLNGTVLEEETKDIYGGLGIYIDVFPVDGYPEKSFEKKYFRMLKKYRMMRLYASLKCKMKKGVIGKFKWVCRCIASFICQIPGVKFYIKREISLARKYDYEKSDVLLCQGAWWNEKGKIEKKIYLDRRLYNFDGIQVWGIKNYHEHLKNLYGDYMTMPPENERVSNHEYTLYVEKSIADKILKGESFIW